MQNMERFYKKTQIPVSQQELYDWHASGAAFERLAPPWETIVISNWEGGIATQDQPKEEQFGDISKGAKISLKTKIGPIWQKMLAEHVAHQEPDFFVDEMRKGPFSHWRHTHRFLPTEEGNSVLEDEIQYKLPLSPLSSLIAGSFARKKLDRMFSFRHMRTQRDLEQKKKYTMSRQKIAVTGASGLVGTQLCAFLRSMGHEVYPVSRKQQEKRKETLSFFDSTGWEGIDAVIHLAGESIAERWSQDKKRRILDSRVQLTSRLATLLSQLDQPPKVFVSASAVGFYGHRATEDCTEGSSKGTGFLSDVCQQWENAILPAKEKSIRCVSPRIGMVLSPRGGALQKMLLPFRMGAGGPVGSGKQWMSWISIDDLVYMLYFCVCNPNVQGPINATTPNPVSNKEFGKQLGRALHRPAIMPLPSFAVRLIFGEMGQALLLEGAKVLPRKAQDLRYEFVHPTLQTYFSEVL